MIKKEVTSHPLAYFVLVLGTIAFVAGFFMAWPQTLYERVVITAYAIFYFSWGIVTHHTKQQATRSLIQEYGLISILGALVLLMLTF